MLLFIKVANPSLCQQKEPLTWQCLLICRLSHWCLFLFCFLLWLPPRQDQTNARGQVKPTVAPHQGQEEAKAQVEAELVAVPLEPAAPVVDGEVVVLAGQLEEEEGAEAAVEEVVVKQAAEEEVGQVEEEEVAEEEVGQVEEEEVALVAQVVEVDEVFEWTVEDLVVVMTCHPLHSFLAVTGH